LKTDTGNSALSARYTVTISGIPTPNEPTRGHNFVHVLSSEDSTNLYIKYRTTPGAINATMKGKEFTHDTSANKEVTNWATRTLTAF